MQKHFPPFGCAWSVSIPPLLCPKKLFVYHMGVPDKQMVLHLLAGINPPGTGAMSVQYSFLSNWQGHSSGGQFGCWGHAGWGYFGCWGTHRLGAIWLFRTCRVGTLLLLGHQYGDQFQLLEYGKFKISPISCNWTWLFQSLCNFFITSSYIHILKNFITMSPLGHSGSLISFWQNWSPMTAKFESQKVKT